MLYVKYDMCMVAREVKVSGSRIFCMDLSDVVQNTKHVLILNDN